MTAPVSADLVELIAYSDYERAKWRAWIEQDPARLAVVCQPGGRFPTVWSLLEHLFLVERRHLARLEGSTPPDATGCVGGDWKALFEYGDLVRADFRHYVEELDRTGGAEFFTFALPTTGTFARSPGGTVTITRRKLALHVLLHEIRHLAQLALAARLAGVAPPGEHDLFFFSGMA